MKWPQPKKPLYAERGDGCGAVRTRWRVLSIDAPLRPAGAPQSMNTMFSLRWFNAATTASVNRSQPRPWWDIGACSATVRVLLSSSTPWSAHDERSPQVLSIFAPYSCSSSV